MWLHNMFDHKFKKKKKKKIILIHLEYYFLQWGYISSLSPNHSEDPNLDLFIFYKICIYMQTKLI